MFFFFAGTEQIPLKAPFFNDSGTVQIILLSIILYIILDFVIKILDKHLPKNKKRTDKNLQRNRSSRFSFGWNV